MSMVDNIFSEKQQRLLTRTLYTSWSKSADEMLTFVALANVGLFYSVKEPAVVPDVMVSRDVQLPDELWEKKHYSYFMWEYGKPPDVVVEVASNRKERELAAKRRLCARLGITYYVVFDPDGQLSSERLQIFDLQVGEYVRRRKTWLPGLGLGLVLWEGKFEEQEQVWLRWCDKAGNLLLTGAETAERLATQLRAAGIEPEV